MSIVTKRGNLSLRLTKPQGNLKSHVSWVEFLTGPDFYPAVKSRFEQKRRTSKATSGLRRIVKAEVYDAYSPRKYRRTFNLLKSFVAEAGQGKTAEIIAFSNVQQAPAISGASKGRFSYAAFFEEGFQKPPEEGGTFIKEDAKPFRPHFQLLVEFLFEFLPGEAQDALTKTIKQRMPRSI